MVKKDTKRQYIDLTTEGLPWKHVIILILINCVLFACMSLEEERVSLPDPLPTGGLETFSELIVRNFLKRVGI